ncbi:hypothetical protein QQS21_010497 [Conoideocrella luteorostrata]|uniref:Major facilitator superfamily (MFS) profile domain-containing protein n=1 Tax=Conoideocrella luteorostrata TaxID=1105319 RepID=A0AAJ0CF12_9HYPO|nr:hypothetical protein QQS21_010497 [Conoideocrella luteorostrata]
MELSIGGTTPWISGYAQFCSLFLVEFGSAILGAPSPRLLEIAVCRDYFAREGQFYDQDPPEDVCKISEVQLQLSWLLTVLSTLSVFAATLMQIPMGVLVDKSSKRLALSLNIASTILYWGCVAVVGSTRIFPVWCFYLAPLFILIGGGPWATGALVFAAVNDSVTSEQRTTAFSVMEATSGIADLVGPLLGSLTMSPNIATPFLIATLLFFLMFFPAMLLTKNHSTVSLNVQPSNSELPTDESEPLLGDHITDRNDTTDQVPTTNILVRSKYTILATCFGSFFLFYLARDSNNYLIPWVSFRFDETMAKAGLLFSLRAVVSSLLYFILLPLASSWLIKSKGVEASAKDLALSTCGIILSSAGSFLVAMAPNIAALAVGFAMVVLGSSVTVTLRSFLASKVDVAFSGRLFTAISATGTIGSLVGIPIMGAAYSWGLSHKIRVVGLPFLVSAVSYLLMVAILICFQVKQ